MLEESVNNYSQEESRKRPLEDNGTERKTKRWQPSGNQPLLKLLVPNYAVGAIIGKGGSVITEMQNKFGGNIRLSANGEYYPGTDERVVIISGEVYQIIDFNNHIMEKVQGDPNKQSDMRPRDEGRAQQIKIILTNAAAGMLIGRGGLTIKAIQEESKAKVSICNQDKASVQGERVLTMSGTTEQRMEACRQVIEKIANDASNMANTSLKYMNHSMGMGGMNANMGMGGVNANMGIGGGHEGNITSSFNNRQQDSNNLFSVLSGNAMSALRGASNMGGLSNQGGNMGGLSNQGGNMGGLSNQSGKSKLKTRVQVQMEVPDVMVGAILGKQGQIIRDFAMRSGAKFKFSDKNEYAAGTTDRILTITGDMNQTHTAYTLINERVEQAGNQMNNR